MRKMFFGIIISSLLFSSCANTNTSKVDPIVLTFAEVNGPNSITGMVDQKFADEVYKLSDGQMQIDIKYNGEYGLEDEVLESIFKNEGKIDMTRISVLSLSTYELDTSKLLTLPFTFESREHFWNFTKSDLEPTFLNDLEKQGFNAKGLYYGEEGFRNFFYTEEVNTLDDIKGKNLNIYSDVVMQKYTQALGANVVMYPYDEFYENLESGKIFGAEQPIINYYDKGFYKVAPYMVIDNHTLGVTETIISLDTWNSLTTEQQDILLEASETAQKYNEDISVKVENDAIKALKKEGVTINEIPEEQMEIIHEIGTEVSMSSVNDVYGLYDELINLN